MSGDDHNQADETTWRVEIYDSAWGGWRTVEDGNGLTERYARMVVKKLNESTTFKYRARRGEVSS